MATLVGVAIVLAGCTDDAPNPPETELPDDTPLEPEPELPPEPLAVEESFNGRLEHGVRVCQPSTGDCNELRPTPDNQELQIPDLVGTLLNGNATMTWQPTSDLTRELRLTVFWVPDCHDCELHFLGGAISESPISVDFDPPSELVGGMIWAYARAPYANQAGDTYIQNDFQQTFTIAIEALIQPPADA